jgi:ADP-ribose pyrophosphatase YjhB (NUDIX family)
VGRTLQEKREYDFINNRIHNSIRIRSCLSVVVDDKLLLVPHYETDVGAVQWVVPGGKVEFGESLQEAAVREFHEETGLQAEITGLLHVSEVILPGKPYHSITLSFSGRVTGGKLSAEKDHLYGEKIPRWFSAMEIGGINYHPKEVVEKALGIYTTESC